MHALQEILVGVSTLVKHQNNVPRSPEAAIPNLRHQEIAKPHCLKSHRGGYRYSLIFLFYSDMSLESYFSKC